jgi:hypothetical protein
MSALLHTPADRRTWLLWFSKATAFPLADVTATALSARSATERN